MQLLKYIIIIAICAGIITWLMPWYMAAAVAFVATVNAKITPGKAFLAGFGGVGLTWLVVALYRDIPNEHILSGRMAKVLGLPNGFFFLLITIVLGAIVGGMAGWSGGVMNKAFRK
jgi:hypothetical protein